MTPDLIELSKRAVACKNFRWMPGMQRHDGYRYLGSGMWARWSDTAAVVTALHMPEQYPDLTDSATLGCMMTLVREAWAPHRGENYICSTLNAPSGWGIGARFGSEGLTAIVSPTCATEAEALVRALEAAP